MMKSRQQLSVPRGTFQVWWGLYKCRGQDWRFLCGQGKIMQRKKEMNMHASPTCSSTSPTFAGGGILSQTTQHTEHRETAQGNEEITFVQSRGLTPRESKGLREKNAPRKMFSILQKFIKFPLHIISAIIELNLREKGWGDQLLEILDSIMPIHAAGTHRTFDCPMAPTSKYASAEVTILIFRNQFKG